MNFLETPIEKLKGIGAVRAKQLGKLGIFCIKDLIYYFPRGYERRGDVKLISESALDVPTASILTVGTAVRTAKIKNGLCISKFRAFDDSGAVEVVFFNSPFVKDVFTLGASFRFFGKFSYSKSGLQLLNPKYEPIIESKPLDDFVPVYPLTEGISSKIIDKLILSVIDEALFYIKDHLPENIRLVNNLPSLSFAIKNAHFPKDDEALKKSLRRLAFDEMLLFGLGIAAQTRFKTNNVGVRFNPCSLSPLTELLPYELTDDQKKAINDIYNDTVIKTKNETAPPMARIIVGDVGSGKTVCAIAAMYISAKSGYQSALMVPTEILAHQHYKETSALFDQLGIRTALLIGSTSQKEKQKILAELADGTLDVVIGTHALIYSDIEFKSLGLIITDEQHRFGVSQRAALKEKSKFAHMLVMSATPIPRTLALTMYGDLDVSKITTMPKGRMRVDTYVVGEDYRARLDDFIKKQVALGGQCYIVCPAIEQETENEETVYSPDSLSLTENNLDGLNLKGAVEYSEDLKKRLKNLRIECLHGKMKASEKERIMKAFSNGELDVIVSTTVIEVGVNVPNASLMIIENAERFGLSQLHQLRGRVGRGSRRSYCVLVSDAKNDKSRARLDVMKSTYNGFEIAERDLLLRGPGDFFSSKQDDNLRQSGGFAFKFAKLCDDSQLFDQAFRAARDIANCDPMLEKDEHALIKSMLGDVLNNASSTIS